LHNEEVHTLYSSPDVVGAINSKRLRWAECVASMDQRYAYCLEDIHLKQVGITNFIVLDFSHRQLIKIMKPQGVKEWIFLCLQVSRGGRTPVLLDLVDLTTD
jgi:hypothetical protein